MTFKEMHGLIDFTIYTSEQKGKFQLKKKNLIQYYGWMHHLLVCVVESTSEGCGNLVDDQRKVSAGKWS